MDKDDKMKDNEDEEEKRLSMILEESLLGFGEIREISFSQASEDVSLSNVEGGICCHQQAPN